jgi:hypothetical protein
VKQKNLLLYLTAAFFTIFFFNLNLSRNIQQTTPTTSNTSEITTNTSPTPSINEVENITTPTSSNQNCIITGCNNEICSNQEIASICLYKEEYACFQNTKCEIQKNGKCGWTMNDELLACLGARI